VTDDDRVFKALADPTRRFLLDRLFTRDGRTLTELESELEMTRFGVMKHLRVLEDVGLVVARRSGREKLHFLNPVPIRLIHDRWIDKYTERRVSALAQRYGYKGSVEYDLRPGGAYRALATEAMKAMGGPDVVVDGEVVEADPPRRLVQTYRFLWDPEMLAEGFTRVTWEIEEGEGGVATLTVTHELEGAAKTAA
jgi:DNA-binding transcriptional ArsR family regulator